MKRTLLLLLLSYWTLSSLIAQQALDVTGGTISVGSNLLIDYSVGEVATITTGTPNNSSYYTAGVIQPVWTITSVKNRFDELYHLSVSPNPVSHTLSIETNYLDFQDFQFTNALGQITESGNFSYEPLDLSWMASGTYFLTLTSNTEQISKTIKIIKQ